MMVVIIIIIIIIIIITTIIILFRVINYSISGRSLNQTNFTVLNSSGVTFR